MTPTTARTWFVTLATLAACTKAAVAPQDSTDAVAADSDGQTVDAAETTLQACGSLENSLRLQQIQAKATHNSYHVAQPLVPELNYEHSPLDVQLQIEGVRSFELDIHPPDEPPGPIQVYHLPGVDQNSNCGTFQQCLTVLRKWSDAHPCHHALLVIIEPKDQLIDTGVVHDKLPLDDYWDQFDKEILAAWPRDRVIAPDDVRGKHPNLREAVTTDGWPTMAQSRGKIAIFIMDNNGHGAWYKQGHEGLQGRMAFVFGPEEATDTAAVQYDNVKTADDVTMVQALVKKGFLVRSFADGKVTAAGPNDLTIMHRALDSGAQMLSTDYPAEKARAPGYVFAIPGGTPSRCNPVNAPAGCKSSDVENLGL